jgi:hypothetical protein
MIVAHSQLVNATPGRDHTKYGKRNIDGTMDFYSYTEIQLSYNIFRAYAFFLQSFLPLVLPNQPEPQEVARQWMIDYLQNRWLKGATRGAANMDAQTRVAASYGLLQPTFSFAIEHTRYPYNNSQRGPEDLNETTVNLTTAMDFMKYQLIKKLTAQVEEDGNWPDGSYTKKVRKKMVNVDFLGCFENWFRYQYLRQWNSGISNYADSVLAKSALFVPQP